MVVNILNNWSRKYISHYIIKFVGFILIYYAINLNIVLSYMVFSYLYFDLSKKKKQMILIVHLDQLDSFFVDSHTKRL